MKFRPAVLFSYFIAGVIAIASSEVIAGPYLFELLSKPTYNKSWNALFVGEKKVDTWLAKYAKTKNGPAGPGKAIILGGAGYQINTVCKAHDCGDNQFFVLFNQDGTKAWGLLVKGGETERFFGNPDDEKKNVLRTEAYK